ncbi:unnamed protein product [Thlaspi arvense]|uniref:Dof zinc finger protein n=1 Tax=Thlaspi arvense TaxID=13288 RepID=A0AAU9T822_THLAR|nr:unnamed protein product [Thlaspi arvense]
MDANSFSTPKGRVMEKPNHNQSQSQSHSQSQSQSQEALKCPRCDSSNTKFCYYNNYSLSQPRHFCKACKRYWTQGGTLRNVPIGGSCRKNKKRSSKVSSPPPPATSNPSVQPQVVDLSSTSINHVNPFLYGLNTSSELMSATILSHPSLRSRASNLESVSGFDLQPQLDVLGYSLFGASASVYPTVTSLLASSLQQQKFISNNFRGTKEADNSFQKLLVPSEDLAMDMKEVKMDQGQNLDQIEQIIPSDPSLCWNNAAGAWLDPANIGSSFQSLFSSTKNTLD